MFSPETVDPYEPKDTRLDEENINSRHAISTQTRGGGDTPGVSIPVMGMAPVPRL